MPMYVFECGDCKHRFDRILKLKDYDQPQVCDACGSSSCQRCVTTVNFNLPGDDWASKNGRITAQMRSKNERLVTKQTEFLKEQSPGMRLLPNVNGEVVSSWSEAKKLAASEGKATSTYDAKIEREKQGFKS